MDGSSASTATPGFGRPKVAASAVNEDVVAGSSPFLEGAAGEVANLRPRTTASAIACIVKTFRDSASVTDDIGGD